MSCFENSPSNAECCSLLFGRGLPTEQKKSFPERLVQNWLCISKGSGSCLSVPLPKLVEEAGALVPGWCYRNTEQKQSRALAVLGSPAAGNLYPERGRKQRSKIYKAKLINFWCVSMCGICFKLWKLLFLCTVWIHLVLQTLGLVLILRSKSTGKWKGLVHP